MSRLHVLLVEDDPANLQLLALRMKRLGYDVTPCENGFAALDALKRHQQFHLAIVDIRMPGMNGTQLIAHIRANPDWSELPILVVSGEVHPNTTGADHCLAKPYTRDSLEVAVTETLHRRGR